MFKQKRSWKLFAMLLVMLIGFGACDPGLVYAGNVDQTAVSKQLKRLADQGKFNQLINVASDLDEKQLTNTSLISFEEAVKHYQKNQQAHQKAAALAFEKAIEKMGKRAAKGDLTKALSSAVEASGLAESSKVFLLRDDIIKLVTRCEAKAAEYKANHDWLEALALYRRLEFLFDDHNRYADQIKETSSHLRVFRLYAPEKWHESAKQYAKAHGDPEPQRWGDEDDTWSKELSGITPTMFRHTLSRATKNHVEKCTYEQLMTGALKGLLLMLHTSGIDEEFPSLKDAQKLDTFIQYLEKTNAQISKRTSAMNYPDASAMLRNLLSQNNETIKLPENVVIYELTEGALGTLDQFSGMIWPKQISDFERTLKQKFTGIGVQIQMIDEKLTVVTPIGGSPAHKAGFKPGDRISSINGKSTAGISLQQAVGAITGPEGTDVKLGLTTPGTDKEREVTLTRKSIRIESVKGFERKIGGGWDYYVDRQNKIGYIRLMQFGRNSASEIDAAVQQMKKDNGLDALILDLRFNPGGLLGAAVDVTNRFLDKGVIVSGHRPSHMAAGGFFGFSDSRDWSKKADKARSYDPMPVIVMVNKGSASASEIVSGALQAHHRAFILGERSYGKGSVQEIIGIDISPATMQPKSQLKLTTQYYQLPDGRIIHRRPSVKKWGIEPEIKIRMTDKQVKEMLKARMLLDILVDDAGQKVDPNNLIAKKENNDGEIEEIPDVKTAKEFLDKGYDQQLESAVLLLKGQLLGSTVLAQTPEK